MKVKEMMPTQEDHAVWHDLITGQLEVVKDTACSEYLAGLKELDLPISRIPKIEEVSKKLHKATGWTLVAVDRLVPNREFFHMLANKQFPVIQVMRSREELDFYSSEEPDMFHELFGHCPLIMNKKFADTMQKLGKYAISCSNEIVSILEKIFWITFEFGIINKGDTTKIFGAGILPSKTEVNQVMNNINTKKIHLDSFTKIETSVQATVTQPLYYAIDKLESLYDLLDASRIEQLLFANGAWPDLNYYSTFVPWDHCIIFNIQAAKYKN